MHKLQGTKKRQKITQELLVLWLSYNLKGEKYKKGFRDADRHDPVTQQLSSYVFGLNHSEHDLQLDLVRWI